MYKSPIISNYPYNSVLKPKTIKPKSPQINTGSSKMDNLHK
jgi:hypothetical protein